MKKSKIIFGKIIYSLIFLVLVPLILFFWAKLTNPIVKYEPIRSDPIAWILIIVGFVLMMLAMFALYTYGKGLPMNAYPPPILVKKQIFSIFKHPIYIGFSLLMVGFFILTESAAGVWLVSPIVLLSLIALVMGYETLDLKKRFPGQEYKTYFDWPENNTKSPEIKNYFFCISWLLILLFLFNFISFRLFNDIQPKFSDFPLLNYDISSVFWFFPGAIGAIIFPFFLDTRRRLRKWIISIMIALGISFYMSFLLPEVFAPNLKYSEYSLYIIPSFLVLISLKYVFNSSKLNFYLVLFPSLFVIWIHLVNSSVPIIQLINSIIIFFIASYHEYIWKKLKKSAEKIANSWKEWTFGKVRIINHGFYVGFGAFSGILMAGILAGKEYSWAILLITFMVVVFSAVWAQLIEGSEKLKRPYGYYGALVGVIFASIVIWVLGFNVWLLIGVFSVCMPWVQAIGRLRCLINGCCHGAKVENEDIGIRYHHHRSRVCGISNLKGELLHPTQLYSIIWLFLIGFVLLSLWLNGFPYPFIFGLYLILTGIGRFVEEAYRGEVQTPILWKLRLYQWTAILSIVIGIVLTVIPVEVVIIHSVFSMEILYSAIIGGLFTFFAMGVDFPYSDARFSRLV